ncbi:urease accessory protein UreF [Brachybacterium sp. MASK1Z-5]|uniref:Urease accessory protein UreF n=1 Tax=Brachybacterium halotolerans TaxID=2795215 RepID=A0ABS1BA58_9MICO|nr:urease accessory UreF family protein [Brachybacterium halotolerans]MBK0331515.1 urease accessory protein UreF [Brachybacterium halotolerans]
MNVPSTTLAMMLADSRLPIGAHVSSNALEAALLGGLSPGRIGEYLATRMDTVARVEAGAAVLARHLAQRDQPLAALHAEWAARTPSRAQRRIAAVLGDGLRRLADRLWPGSLSTDAGSPRPLVLGAIAAIAGLGPRDLARLVAYDDAQTVVAAALKLEPGDPRQGTALVLEACARFEPHIDALAALQDPTLLPSAGAPQIEGWSEDQSVLPRRLFRA